MSEPIQTARPAEVVAILQQTPANKIAELDFVKDKYVSNYNLAHSEKNGELMYHRQMIAFKQAIQASADLQKAEPFSLYACFVQAAVKGYSLDATDGECYLIPRGGKAYLQVQAPAHVKRLMRSGQITGVDQVKLVYKGDEFIVENGRVVKHAEKFESEIFIAGYVRFITETGDRYFIYRKSDWEAWRTKSPQPNGANWKSLNDQPLPAFLRTKIVLHATKEKVWGSGFTPATEQYNVEIEDDGIVETVNGTATDMGSASPRAQAIASAMRNDHAEQPSVTVQAEEDLF